MQSDHGAWRRARRISGRAQAQAARHAPMDHPTAPEALAEMPHVLHMIDAASPQACPTTLALLATSVRGLPEYRHDVLLLGGHGLSESAAAAGLTNVDRLAVPGGRALPGFAATARRLRGRRFDLIHCWSIGTLRLAGLLRPTTSRMLWLVVEPTPREIARLVGLLRRPAGASLVAAAHDDLRRRLIRAGAPEAKVRVVPPGVAATLLTQDRREVIRESWGLASPQTRVIALLGDPPTAADALTANLALGLAYESVAAALDKRPPVRMLMHPAQHRRLQARRMLANYGVGHLVGQEPRLAAPWQVLEGFDAALFPRQTGAMALRWALAAGCPIVAEPQPATTDLLEHGRNALVADRPQVKRLAHHLHQLLLNPALAERLREGGRAAAARRCDPADSARHLYETYASLLTDPTPARRWGHRVLFHDLSSILR